MTTQGRYALTIASHAWNGDATKLAICPNNNEVWIYEGAAGSPIADWERKHVLSGVCVGLGNWVGKGWKVANWGGLVLLQHDLLVSGIDWCPVTGRLLTCSYDRNAFVWTEEGGKWEKSAVVLSLKFAATKCRWAPGGNKFAVASSSKAVQVCFWEPVSRWWVPRSLSRRFKSTVLAVAWHPNGQIVATAGCDYRVRVFSAYLPEADGEVPDSGPFGEAAEFGTLLAEFDQPKTWVHDVVWAPSGNHLAFVTQASEVYVADFTEAATSGPALQEVRHTGLPHRTCEFLSDKALICAGHDMNPAVYALGGDGFWRFAAHTDAKKTKGSGGGEAGGGGGGGGGGFSAARAMFASKTTKGQSSAAASDKITTIHQGSIAEIRRVAGAARGGGAAGRAGAPEPTKKFSTAGDDGRIIVWDVPALRIDGLSSAALGIP